MEYRFLIRLSIEWSALKSCSKLTCAGWMQRTYNFIEVCGWFAARCDLILLLFDPAKLDISDEMKQVCASSPIVMTAYPVSIPSCVYKQEFWCTSDKLRHLRCWAILRACLHMDDKLLTLVCGDVGCR